MLIALGDDLDVVRSGLDELGFGRASRGSCQLTNRERERDISPIDQSTWSAIEGETADG
jgi:hypothetical protein